MSAEEKTRNSGEQVRDNSPVLPTVNPELAKPEPKQSGVHPAVYIVTWIALSSAVILFNKFLLSPQKKASQKKEEPALFPYPILLTSWHLGFATLMTQIMARTTNVLDSRKKVPMTGRIYLRAIVPIGIFFSLSLICGNVTYMYLSVSFIQMLKATTPVAVLFASWALGTRPPNMKTLANVSLIVLGVVIASIGEIRFVMIGFVYQILGLTFEAIRLTMVERLLSSAEFKMDPMVSLYYFAPACAIMNGVVGIFLELPHFQMNDLWRTGVITLVANAMTAFLLNVAVVMLMGKTSALVLTLSGVLKDILLVVASMVIFLDPVSGLQAFGYSIALGGLVYYKLGAEKIKEYIGEGQRAWADYGIRHPAMRKIIVLGLILLTMFVMLGGLAPKFAPQYVDQTMQAAKGLGTWAGDKVTR